MRSDSSSEGNPPDTQAARPRPEVAQLARQLNLRDAQALSRVGSWEFFVDADRFLVSDSMLELFGLERDPSGHVWADAMNRIRTDDQPAVLSALRQLLLSGIELDVRYRLSVDGEDQPRWIDARGTAFRDEAGTIVRLLGTVADVSQHVQAEQALREAHADLIAAHSYQQAVITASPDAIHLYDVISGRWSRANRLAPSLIGYTDETVAVISGEDLESLLPPEDLFQLNRVLATAANAPDGEVVQLRHRVLHADGVVHWLSRRMTPFKRSDGSVAEVLVVSRDVTDVVAVEERLAYAALHDELTGLPNRRLVHDRVEHALHRAERIGQVAVLFCDLDGFKRINDSYGHRAGDEVLKATAHRLMNAIRTGDTVGRTGGDEFVIVLEIPSDADPYLLVDTVARRVEDSLSQPVPVGPEKHAVTVSIGICLAGPDSTVEALLSDADTAMYHAKTNGRNGHALFRPELRLDTLGRDNIERQIRRSLAEDSVEVFYQPVLDRTANSLHGVEALLRLRDQTGELLDTGRVVAVAEQSGLIHELDDRIIHLACAQVAAWRRTPQYRELTLAVNRSAKDIARPGFYDRVDAALTRSGLDADALTLELTETVLLDAAPETLTDLQRLRQRGVGIAIDDFGTGYASLRYLATLPVTCLKIDRSFTNGLPADQICVTLVRATVGLAEDLGLACVVEGVETVEQLQALPTYRHLFIQGYLYGRPQAAVDYLASPPVSPVDAVA